MDPCNLCLQASDDEEEQRLLEAAIAQSLSTDDMKEQRLVEAAIAQSLSTDDMEEERLMEAAIARSLLAQYDVQVRIQSSPTCPLSLHNL